MSDTPETDAFMLRIDDSEIDLNIVRVCMADMERERDDARRDAERMARLVHSTVGGLYYLANVAHDTGPVKRISAEARHGWHKLEASMNEALAAHEALTANLTPSLSTSGPG